MPDLAVEAFESTNRPLAVVEGEGAQCRVVACNEPAAAGGVYPGQKASAADALVPGLLRRGRAPAAERRLLERMADRGGRFTSLVCLDPPNAVLMEVRGSLRLFGGLDALRERVAGELAAAGHSVTLAMAPTPLAASWLARAGESLPVTDSRALPARLGRLPVSVMGLDERLEKRLRGMGVRRLRDVLRLPRDGLARRMGRDCLARLDRALGRRPDPRRPWQAPARFSAAVEMTTETGDSGRIRQAVEVLLEDLCERLAGRQAAVQLFECVLHHGQGEPTRVRVALAAPTRSRDRLAGLVAMRLDSVRLPAPVRAVGLRTDRMRRLDPSEGELFRTTRGEGLDWPVLVERLRARLGRGAVGSVEVVPRHRPEAAWRWTEPGGGEAASPGRKRPLWLLEEPRPLPADDHGRPRSLRMLSGPERIESGWWDGGDIRRDYYVAEDERGARVWIFRDRRLPGRWFLHGYFG